MITLEKLRTLDLQEPSRPGRPAHVSAASGLVRVGGRLHVVADDENHLATFCEKGSAPGTLTRILPGTLPIDKDARKRNKPDFEALVRIPGLGGKAGGALVALGSCSRRQRCSGVILGLDDDGQLDGTRSVLDLGMLHDALGGRVGRLGIGLNIEGALVLGDELVLLQRGNKGGTNARIRFRLSEAIASISKEARLDIGGLIAIEEADLGEIEGVPLCFSDGAALPDGRMAFSAIAEDTSDAYLDGPCSGSALGVMDRNGKVESLELIGKEFKVEGIDASIEGDRICLLLVSDGDDADIPAALLRAEIRG
jgi:hypothetical protein